MPPGGTMDSAQSAVAKGDCGQTTKKTPPQCRGEDHAPVKITVSQNMQLRSDNPQLFEKT